MSLPKHLTRPRRHAKKNKWGDAIAQEILNRCCNDTRGGGEVQCCNLCIMGQLIGCTSIRETAKNGQKWHEFPLFVSNRPKTKNGPHLGLRGSNPNSEGT